uniref:Chromosome 19 open reading frame 47 n=1 Tax=Latimeria chalumnae TaxID=7897 RepID=H3BHS5_LATCH
MASVTLATSEWIQFFKDAGIPPGPAVNYAVTFIDNRIQKNMLMDLTKEIMNELGITVVGDIIAILKHAKIVHRQDVCKAAAESITPSKLTMQAELRRSANTPATRMIANSLSRDSPSTTPVRRPETSTSKISITVSNKMATKNTKAVKKKKKKRMEIIRFGQKENLSLPIRTEQKEKKKFVVYIVCVCSVQYRIYVKTVSSITDRACPTGVFSRLGDTAEPEDDKGTDSDDGSVLQYAGVLKKTSWPSTKEPAKPAAKLRAKADAKPAVAPIRRLSRKTVSSTDVAAKDLRSETVSKVSVMQRLGKPALQAETQDSKVTSSKSKSGP